MARFHQDRMIVAVYRAGENRRAGCIKKNSPLGAGCVARAGYL